MRNHRHTHQKQAGNKLSSIGYQNFHTNVDSGAVAAMQNIETNICIPTNMEESITNTSYSEMTMADYEEYLLHDCYGVMEYNENDAIDYDNNELVNNNIIELNVTENNYGINTNTLQICLLNTNKKKLSLTT